MRERAGKGELRKRSDLVCAALQYLCGRHARILAARSRHCLLVMNRKAMKDATICTLADGVECLGVERCG